ncbi:uncharacterized protein LOC142741342 [Rhinoderma darwinii]|uniref:uncharacterized protein LOC142741342 n=1 Tax=Rhinoderma darwinii TaxID=43563 RepID=UPI003F66BE0C
MYSRTTSVLLFIIVCPSAFCNVNATTTGITPTYSDASASISTENFPPDTTAITVGKTTVSTILKASSNAKFTNDSTTAVDSSERSLVTKPTPVKNSSSPEPGSTTTVSTTVAVPETGPVTSTFIASTTLPSSVASSETGHVSSTVIKSNNTTTVLPTPKTSTPQDNKTVTFPVKPNTTLVSDETRNGLKYSETVLTSIFSTILVVVLLTILAFCFNKYRKRRSQYSHHPLHENVFESEGYSPPDDTLVISGGLYDSPRIYNPNMTVLEEDDTQHEYVSFSGRPGQFRLEFLPGDKDMDPGNNIRRNV